jgi:hypothetical protein
VAFNRQSRALRVYTVPPKGGNPEFYAFGLAVNDPVELVAETHRGVRLAVTVQKNIP